MKTTYVRIIALLATIIFSFSVLTMTVQAQTNDNNTDLFGDILRGDVTAAAPPQQPPSETMVWEFFQTGQNLQVKTPQTEDNYPSFWQLGIEQETVYDITILIHNFTLGFEREDQYGLGGTIDFDVTPRPVGTGNKLILTLAAGDYNNFNWIKDILLNGVPLTGLTVSTSPEEPVATLEIPLDNVASFGPNSDLELQLKQGLMQGNVPFQDSSSTRIKMVQTAVPEPTTLTLLALAGSTLFFRRKLLRKRS